VKFMSLELYDAGAYLEPAICSKLTLGIAKPWSVVSDKEAQVLKFIQDAARKAGESRTKDC